MVVINPSKVSQFFMRKMNFVGIEYSFTIQVFNSAKQLVTTWIKCHSM